MIYAVDEKVLVGNNEHQAYVARPVRAGDDTVLVRWESTGAREEVAVGDVKKIDLDAKRPRRKRRDASAAQAEASAPAPREPPRKRRKKKADADNDESSTVDKILSVAEIRAAYQREQEAARAAASDDHYALARGEDGRRAAVDGGAQGGTFISQAFVKDGRGPQSQVRGLGLLIFTFRGE